VVHSLRRRSSILRSALAVALVAVLVPLADGVSLRRQCRLACKDAINACVAAGGNALIGMKGAVFVEP